MLKTRTVCVDLGYHRFLSRTQRHLSPLATTTRLNVKMRKQRPYVSRPIGTLEHVYVDRGRITNTIWVKRLLVSFQTCVSLTKLASQMERLII